MVRVLTSQEKLGSTRARATPAMVPSVLCVLGSTVLHGPAPCTQQRPFPEQCSPDGLCHPDNRECPPVTTELSCGEHPHSGRDGQLLNWGLTYRVGSAQECCDRCKVHPRHCNSWTFCGLPVCWGLDTGHNHTYGECWLRKLKPAQLGAPASFRQRGQYTTQWLKQHRRARPGCRQNAPWTCSPTHTPYTSGALGGPRFEPSERFETGGGWGNVWVRAVGGEARGEGG